LILLTVFVCVLIFLFQKTSNHQNSNIKKHFVFELNTWKGNATCYPYNVGPGCDSCHANENLWDCVGEDRDWSVVFVDQRPTWKRAHQAHRLLDRCELMVIHDIEPNPDSDWPEDWCKNKCEKRRTHTDTTRLPWTKIVQGDLDTTGKIFDRAVAAIKANETEYIYKKFNSEEHSFGSHIKVLSAAALYTSGDVLEMGTGFFSTPMLHDIVSLKGGRLVVSTDTDLLWLSLFTNLSSPTHQLVGVPVYEDHAHCGKYGGGGDPTLDHAQMSVMGDVSNRLQSNMGTKCPVL